MKDENYWKDAIGLPGESLKTCRVQNRHDYTRAIRYAEKKLRRLRMAAVLCLVMALSSCGAVRGFGEDLTGGSDAFMRSVEGYSNSYNEANDIPRMVN